MSGISTILDEFFAFSFFAKKQRKFQNFCKSKQRKQRKFYPSHPKSGPKAPISGGPQRAKRVMEHPKGGFLKKRQNDHHEQDTVHIPLLMMTRWLGKNVAWIFFV